MSTKKEAADNEQLEKNITAASPNADADIILAEAKAQAEQILADAKAKAELELKEAKTSDAAPTPATDPGEELVSVFLFKDNDKYKDDVFVAVNGERVQIKRGETVSVKRKFADVLEQSKRQDIATATMIERESASFEARAAALDI